jgi:hypothetical protein
MMDAPVTSKHGDGLNKLIFINQRYIYGELFCPIINTMLICINQFYIIIHLKIVIYIYNLVEEGELNARNSISLSRVRLSQ